MRYALLLVMVVGFLATATADEGQDAQLGAASATLTSYAQLVNERKFDELTGLFTNDVDYRSESWIKVQGCKAIVDDLRKSVSAHPELKLSLETGEARRVSATVVLVDGRWTLENAGVDAPKRGGFTATCVSEEGNWKIAAIRDWTDPVGPREALFGDLSWLQGAWTGTSKGVPFRVDGTLTPGGGFLHMAMMFGGKDDAIGLSTLIGLDASTNTIRSWHFLHDGASGEGSWTLKDQVLDGKVRFVTRDGQVIETVRRMSLQKNGELLMETSERRLGDKMLPVSDPVVLKPVVQGEGASPSKNR